MSTFNISGWTLGSSLLALGLNVWQAFICIIIGEILVGLAVTANGLCGGDWHVGFPMINRFVWGLYGSFFPLALRILLSFVWVSSSVLFDYLRAHQGNNSMDVSSGLGLKSFVMFGLSLQNS